MLIDRPICDRCKERHFGKCRDLLEAERLGISLERVKRGRKRVWLNNADRQKAYRERKKRDGR